MEFLRASEHAWATKNHPYQVTSSPDLLKPVTDEISGVRDQLTVDVEAIAGLTAELTRVATDVAEIKGKIR